MSGLTDADFEEIWQEFDAEAASRRFPQRALLRLADFYRRLDAEDRRAVDRILSDWITSEDEAKRFDARALIDEFEIDTALRAVRLQHSRLENVPDPILRRERDSLHRIITRLERKATRGEA